MNLRPFFNTSFWWGKLIGAFFGFLVGGAIGAFFGILIGNFFDQGLMEHFAKPYSVYHEETRQVVQEIFFQATFTIIGFVAKSDGRVSAVEIETANQLMDEMGLNKKQREQARLFFQQGKDPHFDLSKLLNLLRQSTADNPELLKLFMDIQYRSAVVGELSRAKLQALDHIFRHLGFASIYEQHRFYQENPHNQQQNSQSHQRQTRSSTSLSINEAYAILEILPDTSKQKLKKPIAD